MLFYCNEELIWQEEIFYLEKPFADKGAEHSVLFGRNLTKSVVCWTNLGLSRVFCWVTSHPERLPFPLHAVRLYISAVYAITARA